MSYLVSGCLRLSLLLLVQPSTFAASMRHRLKQTCRPTTEGMFTRRRAMATIPANSGKQSGGPLLGITNHAEKVAPQANHFDCAASGVAYLSNSLGTPMFEVIAASLIILSVGILVAHAMDAFRS
jgi:hypothetical protein